ncbi:transcription factor atoh8 [Austrofundulus limnaeus]|uniref:Protein atonal homolog 8 n=1 Tax=Austrofundulus limnaeus TaxID=52670 RepID=A0A2I4D2H9_AUSLI|nr:PREDICTED: protein atonal homolog 8 [Austrofundulus limnaeus]XP_013886424.1 PREDICTED: protein atonal homolog 8 [Austrofundulus limnaeus]
MKKPLPLSNSWNCSINEEPVLYTLPGAKKKLKRKSREPKRLFPSPESETIKTVLVDMSDGNSKDTGTGYVSKLAPFHGQLTMSQEMTINSTKNPSGPPEDKMIPSQSGAIDMRIGINVPGISSRVSESPASPQSHHEISNWPSSISQPLSNRFKFGIHSTFPLSASTSGTHFSGCQGFSSAASPPEQSTAPFILRESQSSECLDHTETQVSSPKESPRKRVGVSSHARGHFPEVKAIQQTRRLLANARERTRVHTISAAFEALRKQVPCYSYGQKLSKLAILRIACNYILSLAQLAELDYSSDRSTVSFSQCVEQCTRTLQAEGRCKKRKE